MQKGEKIAELVSIRAGGPIFASGCVVNHHTHGAQQPYMQLGTNEGTETRVNIEKVKSGTPRFGMPVLLLLTTFSPKLVRRGVPLGENAHQCLLRG